MSFRETNTNSCGFIIFLQSYFVANLAFGFIFMLCIFFFVAALVFIFAFSLRSTHIIFLQCRIELKSDRNKTVPWKFLRFKSVLSIMFSLCSVCSVCCWWVTKNHSPLLILCFILSLCVCVSLLDFCASFSKSLILVFKIIQFRFMLTFASFVIPEVFIVHFDLL